jgi:MATE family multidrug resistance protein
MLPAHWRQNFGPLLSLASRSYFLRIVETLRSLCTVAAVGHLGIEELGALALAKSMIVMTQGPITSALVTNIDRILCRILHSFEGQRPTSARASRVAEEAGLWLQRAAVMLVCAAFGLALVWQAAWHAWKTVGLSDSMCEQAIEFLRVSILGLVPEMLLPLAAVCMLAQGYEAPINGGAIIGVLCHVFLTVIMVYAWEWGIKGAALAGVLSSWLQLVVVLGHICVQNLHEHTWVGFSMEAFLPEPLYALFLAAAPLAWASSNLVLISQIPLLLAASLGPRALGTYVAIEYLSAIFVQVPYALSHASLFKISSQLRSGNGRAAKGTAWLCLFMSLASGLCCSLAILAFSEALSLFFSHDGDVIEDVVQLLPLMALWQVWYGFSMVCYSVLEASGNQRYSLWLKVVSGVLVTMPLSCLMIYAADVGILGLLWSVIFGQAVGALQGFLRVKALDWASLAAKFRMRTLQILRSSAMPYSGMSRTAGAGKGDATRADSACGAGGDGGDRGGGGGCGGLVVPGDMGFDFIAPDGFFYSEEVC